MFVVSVEQKMVCHGEHTYLFAQAMMSILAQEEQGGSVVRRIGQEVQKFALQRCSKILIKPLDNTHYLRNTLLEKKTYRLLAYIKYMMIQIIFL